MLRAMIRTVAFLIAILVRVLRAACRSRADLVLENLALKQQVTALKQARPKPFLHETDRAFWVALRGAWARWAELLVIVKPETVVDWHRRRFRRHWTKISQQNRGPGRPPVTAEVRRLIREMALENGWGAPRIHVELLKLGFSISEASVSRYVPRRPPAPGAHDRWLTFLRNHMDCTAAMDLFTVPTVRLRQLYCFFVIHHGRRHILHFAATYNPTSQWVIQQLREAFPFDAAPRFIIFDRDAIFSAALVESSKSMGTKPCRTSFRSPWQNAYAERWILGARQELFDHVIIFGARHAQRLGRKYIAYHHKDRCHLGLDKDTPDERPVTPRPSPTAKVVALPRVGGLHHRYEWRAAA